MLESLENSSSKQRGRQDPDKVAVLSAWHRVDSRTREALRRCYLTDLLSGYEVNICFMKCIISSFKSPASLLIVTRISTYLLIIYFVLAFSMSRALVVLVKYPFCH